MRLSGTEISSLQSDSLYVLGRSGQDIDILLLSGGGSRGAWGAGVLSAWEDRPRDFDLVTGVSTGALQATAAFLGSDEDLDRIRQLYTSVDDEDILRKRGIRGLVFSDALNEACGLKRLLADYVDEEMLRRVAEAGAQKRVLVVGTVNMDHGGFQAWNLTKIAADETKSIAEREALYEAALLASSSVPIIFSPVLIEDRNGMQEMHVDGGVREQVFVRDTLIPLALGRAQAFREDGIRSGKLTAYVIVNGKIGASTDCIEDCTIPIFTRTLELLLDEAMVGNLYRSKSVLDLLRFEFNLCVIPQDVSVNFGAYEFDRDKMTCLLEKGELWAREGKWLDQIPDPVDAQLRAMLE